MFNSTINYTWRIIIFFHISLYDKVFFSYYYYYKPSAVLFKKYYSAYDSMIFRF